MTDLLAATVALTLLVAAGMAALAGLTLAPWLVAQRMAQSRGFSLTRWGVISLVVAALGPVVAHLPFPHPVSSPADLLGSLAVAGGVSWLTPGALWLLEPGQRRLGGLPGEHQ